MRKPMNKDRLGIRFNVNQAANASASNIPNNESILLVNWLRIHSYSLGTNRYYGLRFSRTTGGNNYISLNSSDGILLRALTIAVGPGTQIIAPNIPFSLNKDMCIATLINRDDGKSKVFVDGILIADEVTTSDPDLSTDNALYYHINAA